MSRRSKQELKDDYLQWLQSQLRDEYVENNRTYIGLSQLMFETPFIWIHPMDENRAKDGLDLRVDFAREQRLRPSALDFLGESSFLEVLIALSRRLEFTAGGKAPGWAWHLLTNLDLDRLSDPMTNSKQRRAQDIMQIVMQRAYLPDGTGGFFPLTWADDDQTRIELWYQLNSYISELHPEHKH